MTPYPFAPKSNKHLKPGQFFAVPLSDGRYAAGRVMAVPAYGPSDRRGLVVGLMDWSGEAPPTAADLAGRKVLAQATTNVRAIMDTGGQVLGERDLRLDGLTSMDPYGPTVTVWGAHAIRLEAEQTFVNHPTIRLRFFVDFPTQRRAESASYQLAIPTFVREVEGAWRVVATTVSRLPIELAAGSFEDYARLLGGEYAGCELAPSPAAEAQGVQP